MHIKRKQVLMVEVIISDQRCPNFLFFENSSLIRGVAKKLEDLNQILRKGPPPAPNTWKRTSSFFTIPFFNKNIEYWISYKGTKKDTIWDHLINKFCTLKAIFCWSWKHTSCNVQYFELYSIFQYFEHNNTI